MNGICYKNTITTIPNWIDNLHNSESLGYAYETDTHFVHFYGKNFGLNVISVGLTAVQGKNGNLNDWVVNTFGAIDIQPLELQIGQTLNGIWRPSLYYSNDIKDAIQINEFEKSSSEQALRILIEKLDEIFLFIEPDSNGLRAYGHKLRELLILACTEIENQWVTLFKNNGITPSGRSFTTQDYVKLLPLTAYDNYEVIFKNYNSVNFAPFVGWNSLSPTQSLSWYDAYNKVKHDCHHSFSLATLENVLYAISACIIVYSVKFGPFELFHENKAVSSLFNQHFNLHMITSKPINAYIPEIELPLGSRTDLFIYDSYQAGHNKPWIVNSISL
jgi:hypothetical protein